MFRTWAVRLAGHRVDRVGEVLPGAADAADVGLAAELALGADLARDARHLGGEGIELIDHRVDRVGQALVLALERPAVDLRRHPLREIASGDRVEDAADLQHRGGQVENELVDRRLVARPASGRPDRHPVTDPALAPDRTADPSELLGGALVQLGDVVERLGNGAIDASLAFRQADPKVAVPQGSERGEKRRRIQAVRLLVGVGVGREVAVLESDRTHVIAAPWVGSNVRAASPG